MKLNFKRNLGPIDRILRAGVGLGAIYTGFYNHQLITDPVAALVFGGIGTISLVVAIVGNCPVYYLIDFSTAKPVTTTSY